MKRYVFSTASIVLSSIVSMQSHAEMPDLKWSSEDGKASIDLGGVIRYNHRYENWKESENRGAGKLNFDIFRLDVKGHYDDFYLNSSFLIQDQEYTSIEKAYIGYKFNDKNSLDAGFVYKPFALYPYPQNGWTYHIPFFLGFGNNIAPGLNYNYVDSNWDIKLGFYPRMLDADLRYSPETATYEDLSENAFANHSAYHNEKHNQFNARLVKKIDTSVGKQELGLSGSYAQLHNTATDDDGDFYAVAVHANTNFKRFNIQGSVINYKYDAKNPAGVDDDVTLMGVNGLSPAYFIASEGTVTSLNVAYTQPIRNFGPVKAIKFYNDYSYLDKKRSDWSVSQMNTTGMMFIASPFLVWADYTWGKNVNLIGGSTNSTGLTSTNSANSDKWLYRINLNIGFSF